MALGGTSRLNPRGSGFRYVAIGGGSTIYKMKAYTAAVDPADLASLTKAGTAVTVAGVHAGDIVVAVPPAALEDDLIPAGAIASGTDTVTLYLYNASAGAVNGASLTWTFWVIHLS